MWKDESTYLKVESSHHRHLAAEVEPQHRAFSPNTLRRKGENMAKALARIMITKVVDRRRKSDIEREAAQKVPFLSDARCVRAIYCFVVSHLACWPESGQPLLQHNINMN